MDTRDWLIVLATIAGPILAVQAQKAVEALRERRGRKERVFAQLMATRAARLSAEHVQALNTIDLVFFGSSVLGIRRRSRGEQAVLDAWKEYHCRRRPNFDPPCRLNNDQGREAATSAAVCG